MIFLKLRADMTAVTIQSEKVVLKERQLSTTTAILWKKKQQQTFWPTRYNLWEES